MLTYEVDITTDRFLKNTIHLFHSDPHGALVHVWNAASHANPPHTLS